MTGPLPRRRAFTLVEVLLALFILGLVMGSVGLVLHGGVEAWRAASERAEESHEAEALMEQIAMGLRSAYYPANGDVAPDYGFQHEDGGDGTGARDVVSWVKIGASLVGEDVPWAGAAHRATLFVSDGEDGQGPGLYVSAWQLVGQAEDFDPERDVEPLLLSDAVRGLDVRMQDPNKAVEPGEPYEWIDEWSLSNRIPSHVLVTLSLKPRSRGEEPDALVRLVDIPLSAVSWNPSKPGGGRDARPGRDARRLVVDPDAGGGAARRGHGPVSPAAGSLSIENGGAGGALHIRTGGRP